MPTLKIYRDSVLLEDHTNLDDIQTKLSQVGIDIQSWACPQTLLPQASQEEILAAYSREVEQIMQEYSFKGVDVISMNQASNPIPEAKLFELRNKFLAEHIHADDEVRYFIEGQGLFVVHSSNLVYMILCEQTDFIAVPANTKHWFDMGSNPNFKCIRFFGEETGWIAEYTGDDIASKYPNLDQLLNPLKALL